MSVEINTPAAFQIEIKTQPPRPIEVRRGGTQGPMGDITPEMVELASEAAASSSSALSSKNDAVVSASTALAAASSASGSAGQAAGSASGAHDSELAAAQSASDAAASVANSMDKPTYDPTGKAADAFAMGNMVEGATAKIMTVAERAAIASAVQPADLGTSAALNVGTTAGTVAAGDDSRLSDERTPIDESVTDAKVAATSKLHNRIVAYVDIRDHGAVGDHVILSGDASITASAATLTFTTGTFTAADIGKKITVPGAGAAGADLVSTIAAVASTTEITLADNAGTTLAAVTCEVSWGTDNSAALQAALDACSNGGARLYVPQGRYRCDSPVTSTGALSVMGYHISQSALIFANNANWDHDGGAVGTGPTSQLFLSGVSVQSDDTHNTSTALLNIHFDAGGSGSTVRTVTALDVEICGTSLSRGFSTGMRLFNATNLRIERPRLAGNRALFAGSVGILVDTDSQAVDFYINNPYAVFLDYGIKVIGQGLGAGFEGLIVDRAMMIACNYGVYVDSVSYHPYVHVSGSNLCCFKKCIYIKNMINIQILGNYLYPAAGGANATWEGIHIDGDVVFPQYAQNIIANNIISGRAAIDIATRTGIKFNQPAGSNQQTLVDANSLDTLEIGEYLGANVANVVSTTTNQFRTTTVVFDDLSGTTTNILAGANFATPGNLTETSGLQMRWGLVGVTLDTNKRATITFTDPFKSACLVVTANTGTAAKTGRVTSDSYAKTGFSVYLPDQVSGDSLNINYIALGA